MKLMLTMMKMLPSFVKKRMAPPMIRKSRLAIGQMHPTIEMNLTNFLICTEFCGTCPTNLKNKGEMALFCTTGQSSGKVEEKGCKCVECPLLEKCSMHASAYFCIKGACHGMAESEDEGSTPPTEYIKRFMIEDPAEDQVDKNPKRERLPGNKINTVKISFAGDKDISTQSNVPILRASLEAGIPHTHVCGGRAKCSTCRIIVTEGLLKCNPRNNLEAKLAHIKGFTPEVRLACQTTVNGDVSVRRLVLDDNDISDAINQQATSTGEGGKEVKASILFSDIRSFTSFTEKALPYDVVHILNRYFDTIGKYIDTNGGYIDKYMGDGIMAIFGLDDKSRSNPALYALQAAYKILAALNDFNAYLRAHFNHEFKIGIGVHTGEVVVGNLGFHKKKEFTAIGDTVNTASRIEALTKSVDSPILVSEETYLLVKNNFVWGKHYRAKVKGKEKAITVYQPLFDSE